MSDDNSELYNLAAEIDRLRRELAAARALLLESTLALDYCQMKLDEYVASGQYTDDRPLIARIDAFLGERGVIK